MSSIIKPHSIKNEIKETLSIGIPLTASQLIYASSGFIGTALVAKLGEDALAASILVSTVWMTMSVLFFGILNSVSVLTSHAYGAKNYKEISNIMGQAYLLGIMIIILMIIVLSFMPVFLRFRDQPPAVIKLATDYMHALLWTMPGLIILIISEQFLAGINRAKIVLRISLLVVPIEIPLIYLLIFGKLGLPACGVAGIGYGFAITYTITAISLLCFLYRSSNYRKFNIFNGFFTVNFRYLKELVSIGLPMGFMHVIEVSTFTIATYWIARFGTTMLAAHQIVFQFLGFVITLVFAMSQAVTVRVGHAVGEQNLIGVRYASFVGMLLNFGCITLVALGFYFMPNLFLHLDIDVHAPQNAALVQDASALLAISGVLLLFDNCRIIGFGALRGLKNTRFPMYTAFFSFWIIGLSAAYILGFKLQLLGPGIWWGLTIGIATGAVMVLVRLYFMIRHLDLAKLAAMKSNVGGH